MFGAHPLSNVFNEAPVLLVEGEDDERIWQQAVRSSDGALKLYPVDCGSVDVMHDYEKEVKKIMDSVYDDAEAFSLRDRDETDGEIDDMPPVVRMKLECRAAENLLLTTEVLASVGLSWEDVEVRIEEWLSRNEDHEKHAAMKEFKDSGYDRKGAKLKDLRMLVVGVILASNKPWEVLVGSALSKARLSDSTDFTANDSIFTSSAASAGSKSTPSSTARSSGPTPASARKLSCAARSWAASATSAAAPSSRTASCSATSP